MQNWPFPMTGNRGETIAGALPRCRLVFTVASLLYPEAEGGGQDGRYARIAAGSSTGRMISSRLASAWRAIRDCSSRASCLWIRQPCTRSKKQIAEVFTARGAPSAHPLLPQRPAPAPRSCQRSQVPRRDQQRRRLPPPLPCPIRLGISACLSPRGRCGAPRCRESPRLPGKAGPV